MAQFSLPWSTTGVGDGAAAITEAQLQEWLRSTFTSDRYATEGVVPSGSSNQLAVSGTSSPIAVAPGSAWVYGVYINNSSTVNFTISTPSSGTTGHRVVLRYDSTAKTVRLVLKSSADGTSTPPGLTQTAGVTWEISLATLTITTGGTITITDTRDYSHPGRALIVRRQGGSATDWSTPGTTTYTPGAQEPQSGSVQLTFPSSATGNLITVNFPVAFTAKPLVFVTPNNNGSSTGRKVLATVEAITTTSFQVRGYIADGASTSSSFDCYWFALGPK